MSQNDAADNADANEIPVPEHPQVNISTSTFTGFGSLGTTPQAAPSNTAEQISDNSVPVISSFQVPSLDNGETELGNLLLRGVLERLPAEPSEADRIEVLRNIYQGHLFVPVNGDAAALLKLGKDLPLSLVNSEQGPLLMLFTGMDALNKSLAASGAKQEVTAIKQPIKDVMQVLSTIDVAGVLIDGGNDYQSAFFTRELLLAAYEDMDKELRLRNLALQHPSPARTAAVLAAMADAPMWLAGQQTEKDGPWGVAENRSAEGISHLELFSHPLEVRSRGRGDRPLPVELPQLLELITQATHLDGVVIDPSGPSIELGRRDFAPLLTNK